MAKKEGVRKMFDNIAPEYDRLNHILSLNIDKRWRTKAVRELADEPRPLKVLDVACGTGDFTIEIARKVVPGSEVLGVDISEDALLMAKENAKNLGLDATFIHSDLFEQVEGEFDIIVSNPPYIRTKVIEELEDEVKLHDPWIALDGKEDGLCFYRKIIESAPKFLKKGGALYFEIGHDQGQEVKQLMEQAGFSNVTVKKDLAGLDRVVFGV